MKAFQDSPDVNPGRPHSRETLRRFETHSLPSRNSELHTISQLRSFLEFDHAGVCRPAKEAPCNFVDAESLTNGDIAFAIGDAESLSDPLPLLCVRHYFRRSISLQISKPVLVAGGMNGLIYDCCNANCSFSCFYAQYSRASKVLRYVNAGHDAPVLIRSNPTDVLRLETGGPVFGLQESPRYFEGVVQLKPGDRLVVFTQGIIHCLAAQNGGSVESLLVSLVRKHRTYTAFALANLIVAECEDARSQIQLDGSLFVASVDEASQSTYANVLEIDAVLAEA